MVISLQEMGFEIEASHHEVAPGQHEIDFKYSDALRTADNLATFRFVVRTIAHRHGLHATFMPKPITAVHGSGMHTHLSLFREGKMPFTIRKTRKGSVPTAATLSAACSAMPRLTRR